MDEAANGCSHIYVTTLLTMIPEPYELKQFLWGVGEMHRYFFINEIFNHNGTFKKKTKKNS